MGILICFTNLLILFILSGYLIVDGPQWYQPDQPISPSRSGDDGSGGGTFLMSTSIFNKAPEFCFTFHFQIYFLIVLQYLGHKNKVSNGYKVAVTTNVTVLVFCIVYAILCISTDCVFSSFNQAIYRDIKLPNKILVNVLLLFVTSLQIPFKFFLQKEFLFIFYDELKNKGVSTKIIDRRKKFFSPNQITQ